MPSNYEETTEDTFFGGVESKKPRSKKDLARLKLHTIKVAEEHRRTQNWDEKFTKFLKVYSGQYDWDELAGYEDQIVPNMIFSTVNIIVPSISVRSPKINVTAKRPEEEATAETVQAVVNHQWDERDVQSQVRQAVKDMVILGHGWLAVEWEHKEEERQLSLPEWQAAAKAALDDRNAAVAVSELAEDEFPSVEETLQGVERTVTEVVVDAPRVTRFSPFDVLVDPDAMLLTDARWVAARRFVPIEAARENERWSKSNRDKLKPSVVSEARKDVHLLQSGDDKPKDDGFVVVWDFYNLLDGTVCVLTDNIEGYLEDPRPSPFPGTHPFVFLANYEVPERFFPIGDIEMIYGLQVELAITRTQMINDRKRGRRITLYRGDELGQEGVDQLEQGADNVMIDVVSTRPFDELFTQVASAGLHPEWYAQADMILNDINMVAGVSEYDRGQIPEITRTATEAGLIQDASNSRSSDKLARVERAMAEVAERMIKLNQRFLDVEDVARVVSDDQLVSWVPFTRDTIQGDFVFDIEAGSSQPLNESFRRQSALQMMDAFGALLGTGYMNDQKFLEYVMRQGFGITNAQEFVGAGPAPLPPEGDVTEVTEPGVAPGEAPVL